MEPGPQHGRCEGGKFGLDRGPERVREPLRRLHHDVDEVATAVQAQLGALFVEIRDRLFDLGPGVRADAGAFVQDAVDRRLAQPGLLGDLADLIAVRHRNFLRCF